MILELPHHSADVAAAAKEIAAFALARLNLHADVQSALSIASLLVECEARHFEAERLQKKFQVGPTESRRRMPGMNFLRRLKAWWFFRGYSLQDLGYPSIEELRAAGYDPRDFYYHLRFGLPLVKAMTYERGLREADVIVSLWMGAQRSASEIELLQAIRADLALRLEAVAPKPPVPQLSSHS